jgi:hypothetical protein
MRAKKPVPRLLVETDEGRYTLEGKNIVFLPNSSVLCAFPRSAIYCKGERFEVLSLNTGVDPAHRERSLKRLLVSRSIRAIFREDVPFGIEVEFVAFEFGSELSTLEPSSFAECSALRALFLPATVQVVGKLCFNCCSALGTFLFEPGSTPSKFEAMQFQCCDALSVITIPNTVRVLRRECFSSCKSLSLVLFELGSEIAMFETGVFSLCGSLTSFTVPASVRVISKAVFEFCRQLTVVLFEPGSRLRFIDKESCWLASVKEVHIPKRLHCFWEWFDDYDYELVEFEDDRPEGSSEDEEEDDGLMEINSEDEFEEYGEDRFREYLQQAGLDPVLFLGPPDQDAVE